MGKRRRDGGGKKEKGGELYPNTANIILLNKAFDPLITYSLSNLAESK